jgi:hypothetical protein
MQQGWFILDSISGGGAPIGGRGSGLGNAPDSYAIIDRVLLACCQSSSISTPNPVKIAAQRWQILHYGA